MSETTPWSIERILKFVGTAVTAGGLLFAIVQFTSSQAIEARKPFLMKKIAWCEAAVKTAAKISVGASGNTIEEEARFWELYWGLMGLVENDAVTRAMIDFGDSLKGKYKGDKSPKELSLAIAHACRKELAADWSPIWDRRH